MTIINQSLPWWFTNCLQFYNKYFFAVNDSTTFVFKLYLWIWCKIDIKLLHRLKVRQIYDKIVQCKKNEHILSYQNVCIDTDRIVWPIGLFKLTFLGRNELGFLNDGEILVLYAMRQNSFCNHMSLFKLAVSINFLFRSITTLFQVKKNFLPHFAR